MKVLYVNAVCGTGSTGNIIADLIELLRSEGDRGCVCFGIGHPRRVRGDEAVKFNHKVDYYLHNALSRLTDHTGRYSKCQTRRLLREMEKFDPDIIHLHNLHGYYVNYEMLFRWLSRRNKPVVWTLHDCWAMTGHCTHFVGADCEQWKAGCEKCALLREYPICYTRGDVAGNYRRKKAAFTSVENMTIVTPSQWLADLAKESFLGKYPVQVIPNGVDTTVFRPRESDFRRDYGLEDKKIVLGVANVWSEKKGLGDFYWLAERLPAQYQVVLVGLTPQQLEKLPENILGITRTANPLQLAQIYSAADVFVNPTYEDTFPTVNLEAQACGTPVVSYDVCGCPETVIKGCGTVVPTGDPRALMEQIRHVVENPHRSGEQSVCTDRLKKENSYRKYIQLYQRLSGKKGSC